MRSRAAGAAVSRVEGSERLGELAVQPIATAENYRSPKAKYPATDSDTRRRVDDAK
jgi:hypothetical protein